MVVALEVEELDAPLGQEQIAVGGLGGVAADVVTGSRQVAGLNGSLELAGSGVVSFGHNRRRGPDEAPAGLFDMADPDQAAGTEHAEPLVDPRAAPKVRSGVGGERLKAVRPREEHGATVDHQHSVAAGLALSSP